MTGGGGSLTTFAGVFGICGEVWEGAVEVAVGAEGGQGSGMMDASRLCG
jgi:hypothetical protein